MTVLCCKKRLADGKPLFMLRDPVIPCGKENPRSLPVRKRGVPDKAVMPQLEAENRPELAAVVGLAGFVFRDQPLDFRRIQDSLRRHLVRRKNPRKQG